VTGTATVPRATSGEPAPPPSRHGFGRLLHAEWTKLRTVRGWVVALGAAALVTLLMGWVSAAGSQVTCSGGPEGPGGAGGKRDGGDVRTGRDCAPPPPPVGPEGLAVTDSFFFVHRTLVGDGSITVRVTSLTGRLPEGGGTEAWAKAGLIVKDGTRPGSSYAAVMVTGGHGVRLQHDYTHDVAGRPGAVTPAAPRWLRLTRAGDTLTAHESTDGTRWTEVGSVRPAGLPATVEAGLFVTSPEHVETTQGFGGGSSSGHPTLAAAGFDQVSLSGAWRGDAWRGDNVGGEDRVAPEPMAGFEESGGRFLVTASGDIAPLAGGLAGGPTSAIELSLVGAFAGLIVVIVLGTLFVTSEYRRGLVRTTFTVSPARLRVLAAKTIVLGTASFVVGLVASFASVALLGPVRRDNGDTILPVPVVTEVRIVLGTAAVFALAAVLGLAVGTVLRRGAGAAALVVVLVVLPYLLAVSAAVPLGVAQWLLRVTPAAAFAVQQSIPAYDHVAGDYTPPSGYFPLPPLAGLGVLCAWTAAALILAAVLLRRRDA
jgi:hypothetical protein